jgi:hypothetical protein
MSNPKRGELEIVLGEKKYKAKVTLDIVMRIEQSCGKGIVKIAHALSEGELTTSQMVAILTPVIRGGGNDISEKQVGESLWGGGLVGGMKAVGEIVALVLSSGGDEGNEEQAEALL